MRQASSEKDLDIGGPPPPPPPPAGSNQPFLVWLEGLVVSEAFSFSREYVVPCQAQFGDAFLEDQ